MLGLIGLGRMGLGMAKRWSAQGLRVVGYDPDPRAQTRAKEEGLPVASNLGALVAQLPSPKTLWLMVPAEVVDAVLEDLGPHLTPGDLVVDGGNSFYRESQRRGVALAQKGVGFVDVGVSGGLWGAKEGYGLMVGGEARWVVRLEPYLAALAPEGGWVHAGTLGAGHYTKMVHNGVEYALMEAYAEGAELLYAGREELGLDPARILSAWRQGTIVRSFLLDRLAEVLQGPLQGIAPLVEDSGEGRWAVEEGLRRGVPLPAMAQALFARWESQGRADLGFRLLALLRQAFGGHAVRREDEG